MELPIGRKLTVEVVVRDVEDVAPSPDTARYPPFEDLSALIARTVEEAVGRPEPSKEVMNARDTAEFLAMSRAAFNKLAPSLPRHRLSENRYVYLRSELLEWLMGR